MSRLFTVYLVTVLQNVHKKWTEMNILCYYLSKVWNITWLFMHETFPINLLTLCYWSWSSAWLCFSQRFISEWVAEAVHFLQCVVLHSGWFNCTKVSQVVISDSQSSSLATGLHASAIVSFRRPKKTHAIQNQTFLNEEADLERRTEPSQATKYTLLVGTEQNEKQDCKFCCTWSTADCCVVRPYLYVRGVQWVKPPRWPCG